MNFRHSHFPKLASAICAAAFLCAAAVASAQPVYKRVSAAGQTTFSDRPDTAMPPQIESAPNLDVTKAPARMSVISSRRAALIDAKEAARRLRQEQLNRERGWEPIAGEKVQGADASAVNHRYWRRQETLRRAVENAQRRARETNQPQLAGR